MVALAAASCHILRINGTPISQMADLVKVIDESESDDALRLELLRFVSGQNRFMQHVFAELAIDDLREIKFTERGHNLRIQTTRNSLKSQIRK